jgi:hypothetical protein
VWAPEPVCMSWRLSVGPRAGLYAMEAVWAPEPVCMPCAENETQDVQLVARRSTD